MCRQFGEVFTEWNVWTKAWNFLLVEKLSSSTQEEEWKEIASQCDCSPTYETEAYQLKARRKFAAAKGLPFDKVTLKQVEESDLGLQGYAEMIITVPGIEVVDDDTEAKTKTAAASRKSSKRKEKGNDEAEKDTGNQQDSKKTKIETEKPEQDNKKTKKPKAKAKPEGILKEAETTARSIVLQIQRAQQTTERLQEALKQEPWAVPLLGEFESLQTAMKLQLSPTGGEDIAEFVNELKLCVFSGAGASSTKALKKEYKDNYVSMLCLFADRCKGTAQQLLGHFHLLFSLSFVCLWPLYQSSLFHLRMLDLACKMDNMFKAGSVDADSNPKGGRRSGGKKRARADGSQ
ncbi:unnamed protein product [Symbiodinium necroappetens]|uniref:Uncharacterized protein n=1 Tax=Symbiodinium necroappetens TaxID=1628268 RepID=A0A812ZSS4_9DINO|nr:unnamed protein product [Symbiodinium necroappetens]